MGFQWFSLIGLLAFTFEFLVQFIYNWKHDDKLCLDNDLYPGIYGNSTCTYDDFDAPGNFSANGLQRTAG